MIYHVSQGPGVHKKISQGIEGGGAGWNIRSNTKRFEVEKFTVITVGTYLVLYIPWLILSYTYL